MSETVIVKAEGRTCNEELKQRVEDVMELIMAGSSFSEIREYAANREWNVSVRQLQRYQGKAYQRLAQTAHRNSEELLGRHLQQRRTLYAQCVRRNDWRTALKVLRDEAELNGLYPGKNGLKSVPTNSPLSLRERSLGLLIARSRGDTKQIQLLEHASPARQYRLRDIAFPHQTLEVLTLRYVCGQLHRAAICMSAGLRTPTGGGAVVDPKLSTNRSGGFVDSQSRPGTKCDPNSGTKPAAESEPYASSATVTPTGGAEVARDWNRDAAKAVHWYRVRFDAWQQFMQQLGLEPELLVKLYYRANVLEYFDNMLCPLAPSLELLQGLLDNAEMMEIESTTAECFARAWRKEFAAVCPR